MSIIEELHNFCLIFKNSIDQWLLCVYSFLLSKCKIYSCLIIYHSVILCCVCAQICVCVCVMGRSAFWLDADHEAPNFKSDEIIGWSIWNFLKGVNLIASRRRKCWPRVSTSVECFQCPRFLFPPYPCTASPEVDYALLIAPSTYIIHR